MDIASVANKVTANLKTASALNDDDKATKNGISLLALKNDALLAYISSLAFIAAAQATGDSELFENAVKSSIEHRVTLEKGIRPLESKLSYQIDKALRAYRKSLETQTKDNESESDSDIDESFYQPNASRLATKPQDESDEEGTKKYTAPKISATMPAFKRTQKRQHKNSSMEDYLRESADAPMLEPSIGSTIMDHGRGGQKTEHQRQKERQVQDYEEANFTRVQSVSAKQGRREARQRQRDAISKSFFGEDWGFGNEQPRKRKRKGKKA